MIGSFPFTEIGENIARFESNPYAKGSIQYRTSSDQTTILFQLPRRVRSYLILQINGNNTQGLGHFTIFLST